MKNGIMAILAAVSLAAITGCDSQAEPNASLMLRYQVDAGRDRSWWLTRDGVLLHSAAQPKKFIPLPGWLWAADPHCPPDFTLGPNGEAVVIADTLTEMHRRLLKIEPDPFKRYGVDVAADYSRVEEV